MPVPSRGEHRGRRRAAVALVTLAGLAAGAWWWWWLPSSRPALRPGERMGIDVSRHQGPIDWDRVADDGVDFAYVKVSEGSEWVRRFLLRPSEHGWFVWQAGGYAQVDGIEGRVDLDVLRDTLSLQTEKEPGPLESS